ncbi:helix-turn-helix transcriptional regulator [Acidisoma cellulosilytica]|uniref:Helix-turn-helix transcriptional regulator n=1 Tax=Acidisoma cellulosilyticum TaxID=2802395 RepID=A0A963Z149_9PROT|nr:helix-turn-helix transcriptional regulator [Acidisoma cellulosilyticum]MCB8880631.1 helix-turn-helix transcriptional regulator [Acidisoma cellulosilyticum]
MAGTSIEEHRHAQGQLSVVTQGTMMVTAEEGAWLAPPGRGVWVPPYLQHGARYSESSVHIRIFVDPTLALDLPDHCRTIDVTPLLRELALDAVRLSVLPAETEELALVASLILRHLRRPAAALTLFVPYGKDPRLRRVTQHLLADPGSRAGLDELAKLAGASPRTLLRLFQAETGMTLSRWREHLRVTVAVDRLTLGQSITETALGLGYQSPSAFTTMFTRLMGQPPSKLLRTLD